MSEPHRVELGESKDVKLSVRINGERVKIEDKLEGIGKLTASSSDNDASSAKTSYRYLLDEERVQTWHRREFDVTKVGGEPKQSDWKLIAEFQGEQLPDFLPDESEVEIETECLEDAQPTTVNKVAGLDEQKQELCEFLSVTEEDIGISEPTGIILEGPPGTGKTELVQEVCQERFGSIPVIISGPEILNKWVGGSERLLRQKFEEARNSSARVLYIDELDAIAQSRTDVSESYSAQIVAQLLVLLDGVEAKIRSAEVDRPLKVIASTNISHVIDPALKRPGRLGNRPIQFDYPDKDQRKAILHHYLENIYTSEDGDDRLSTELEDAVKDANLDVLDKLVEQTEGSTGADIFDLIQASVGELRASEKEKLDEELIESVYEQRNFESRWTASDEEIEPSPTAIDKDSFEVRRDGPLVYSVDEDGSDPGQSAKDIARDYFANADIGNNSEDDIDTYIFRSVTPKNILDSNERRVKEHIVQAFRHNTDERIALYLQDAKALLNTQQYSPLVEQVVAVINERLLQWEKGNLLIVSKNATDIADGNSFD